MMKTTILLLAYSVSPLYGATYYVSPSGSDKAHGTSPRAAWRTVHRANQTRYAPGDSVLLQGGEVFPGRVYLDQSSMGTPEMPITISSWGTGRATIAAPENSGAIYIYNTAGIRISNLNVTGNLNSTNRPNGIMFYNDLPNDTKLSGIRISDVEASGFNGQGISIGGWNGKSGFADVRITNVIVHDNTLSGINVWGPDDASRPGYAHRNVYIGYSKAYNNPGVANYSTHSGSGIVVGDTDGGTVERSVASANGSLNTTWAGPYGIWAYDVNNFVIQYNESYGNETQGGADGGGFDLDGGAMNSVMQYNYSHDNDGPGYLLCLYPGSRPNRGNIVRYNISQNDGRRNSTGAIHLYSTIESATIHNNTVFMTPAPTGAPSPVVVQGSSVSIAFRNNIFYSTVPSEIIRVDAGQSGMWFQGNDYWTGSGAITFGWAGTDYSGLVSWRSATGQERLNGSDTGLAVDPGLNAPGTAPALWDADLLASLWQYKLQAGSPLIDAGVTTGFTGTDFYGAGTPQGGVDIGVSETVTIRYGRYLRK